MPKRKIRTRGIVAVLAVVGLVTLGVFFWPRERLLLERGKAITPLLHCDNQGFAMSYWWLSDHELLLSRYKDEPANRNGNGTWTLARHDLETHSETELKILSALLNKTDSDASDILLSPDGKYALWSAYADGFRAHCIALDGSEHKIWQLGKNEYRSCNWLADSRHWFNARVDPATNRTTSVDVCDREQPAQVTHLPLNALVPDGPDTCFSLTSAFALDGNRLISNSACHEEDTKKDEIVEVGLDKTVHLLKKTTVAMPSPGIINTALFSPQGDRIAWLLQTTYTPPFAKYLHRFLPMVKLQSRSVASVWVSRRDGTQMHEIGHIDVRNYNDPIYYSSFMPSGGQSGASALASPNILDTPEELSLRWMPDGKHLSFFLKDRLWKVAAD